MSRDRLEVEFGQYSAWLVEACMDMAVQAVPAVARGTGRPSLLELAAAPLNAAPGKTILDLGCGLGGPSAWLARATGADVVGVDVMLESIKGVKTMFPEVHAVVSSMRRMPIRDRSFDGAWSLGALEMVADKAGASAEIARVLKSGAPLVVYDFVLSGGPAAGAPQADRFSPATETIACLERAGFSMREARPLPVLAPTPEDWVGARESVRSEVRKRHGSDSRFKIVEGELRAFRSLVEAGVIEDWLFVASKEAQ